MESLAGAEERGEALVIVRTGCGARTKWARKEWLGLPYCVCVLCAFPSAQEGGMCLVMRAAAWVLQVPFCMVSSSSGDS